MQLCTNESKGWGGGECIKISTFGSMQMHKIKYLSTFEDKYGNIDHKEINHPQVCHFLYDYLPLIDKHNKQRYSLVIFDQRSQVVV